MTSGLLKCTRGPEQTPCGNVPNPGEKFKTGKLDDGAHCRKCYLMGVAKRAKVMRVRTPVQMVRPVQCEHLGSRLEYTVGCNGMKCKHSCELHLPAVPALYCQKCTSYKEGQGNWV